MTYAPRRATFVPTTAAGNSQFGGSANSVMATRLADKKQELESLMLLRDLSATFANQMEQLQEKLSTLVDGTEAVALVVSNWDSILRVINMASTSLAAQEEARTGCQSESETDSKSQLPETLVRIPANKDKPST
ncbi:DASH complex subunit Dad2-domain-containing protein [Lipomyces arxii]|uniref:DASH complex subunit Dad2-domain-containing protein n=1 Tax=Lipomyces arxii TaxID=56418 RepID=UPI0034CE2909